MYFVDNCLIQTGFEYHTQANAFLVFLQNLTKMQCLIVSDSMLVVRRTQICLTQDSTVLRKKASRKTNIESIDIYTGQKICSNHLYCS